MTEIQSLMLYFSFGASLGTLLGPLLILISNAIQRKREK